MTLCMAQLEGADIDRFVSLATSFGIEKEKILAAKKMAKAQADVGKKRKQH